MVQLIKAPKVSVVTKDGECEINISLDININVTGGVAGDPGIRVQQTVTQETPKMPESSGDSFIVPSFTKQKIKFGKKELAE